MMLVMYSVFPAFQFQTGAIKSDYLEVDKIKDKKFQFQTGAIKRTNLLLISTAERCFNSKLVRLKVLKRA